MMINLLIMMIISNSTSYSSSSVDSPGRIVLVLVSLSYSEHYKNESIREERDLEFRTE